VSNVGIWTKLYRTHIHHILHLENPILLSARFWQFSIELCRVLWIDFSEKGKLQLKVTVENRNKDNRSYKRLMLLEALRRKEETREQNI